MLEWLLIHKIKIQETTYVAYETQIKLHIAPYFNKMGITMQSLSSMSLMSLQKYYAYKMKEGLSANTINKHHANIHSALCYAIKTNQLKYNPADNVEKLKKTPYIGNFLNPQILNEIYHIFNKSTIYTPIMLAGIMGLRRSEVLGLKWENIDFDSSTLEVTHTAVKINKNGKSEILFKDNLKNSASRRKLPMPSKLLEHLHDIKKIQVLNYVHYQKNYNKDYLKYVCVNEKGNLIKPDFLSNTFKRTLISHNMKPIRFHNLRHSCASTLFSMGFTMKDIQEWLGHSNITTTSNIYTHIDFKRKINIAIGLNDIIT